MENLSRLENVVILDENLRELNVFGSNIPISTDSHQTGKHILKRSKVVQSMLHAIEPALATCASKKDSKTDTAKLLVSIPLNKINIKALTNIGPSKKKPSIKSNQEKSEQSIQLEPMASKIDLLKDDLFLSSDDEDDMSMQTLFNKEGALQQNLKLRETEPTALAKLLGNEDNGKESTKSKGERPKLLVSIPLSKVNLNALPIPRSVETTEQRDGRLHRVPHNLEDIKDTSLFRGPRQQKNCEKENPVPSSSVQPMVKNAVEVMTEINMKSQGKLYDKERGVWTSKCKPVTSQHRMKENNMTVLTASNPNRIYMNNGKNNLIMPNLKDASLEEDRCQKCKISRSKCLCSHKLLEPQKSLRSLQENKILMQQNNMLFTTDKRSMNIERRSYASSCDIIRNQKEDRGNYINQPTRHFKIGENNHQHFTEKKISLLPKEVVHMKSLPQETRMCPGCWFYINNCDCLLITMLENLQKGVYWPAIPDPVRVNQVTKSSYSSTNSSGTLLEDIMDKMGKVPTPHSDIKKLEFPKRRDIKTKPPVHSNQAISKDTPIEPSNTKPNSLPKLEIMKSSEDSQTTDSSSSYSRDEEEQKENKMSIKRKERTSLENDAKRQKLEQKNETSYQRFKRIMKTMGIKRPKIVTI